MRRLFKITCILLAIFISITITSLAYAEKIMQITSSAFLASASIPSKYTCDGADLSPPLEWQGVPEKAKTWVLICDDPDAPMGTWDHWVLYNIPATTQEFAEGNQHFPAGTQYGKNSWGSVGYRGPCPPQGREHRYLFKLYALDTVLTLPPAPNKTAVESAMKGHILATAELMGKYQRK